LGRTWIRFLISMKGPVTLLFQRLFFSEFDTDNTGTRIRNHHEGNKVLMDPSHGDNEEEEQLVDVGIVKLECEDIVEFDLVDPINSNDGGGTEAEDSHSPAFNQNEVVNVRTSKRSNAGRPLASGAPSSWRVVDDGNVSYSQCRGREVPIVEGFGFGLKNSTATTKYYRCITARRNNCNAKFMMRHQPGTKSKQFWIDGQHSHDPVLPTNDFKFKSKKLSA